MWFKLRYCLFYTVFTLMLGTINETAPHHDAAERLQSIRQHIGTVGMTAVVVEWSWLSFRISLHEKTAEVGYQSINLLCLLLPPALHFAVERVGSVEVAQCLWRTEVYRYIYPYAPWAEDVCNLLHLVYIFRREHLWRSVHVVEHGAVDANRSICHGVSLNEFFVYFQLLVPENAFARISALYGTIDIVPMVEQTQREERFRRRQVAPEQ